MAIVITMVDHVGNRFVELGHLSFVTRADLDTHWLDVPDGPEWDVIVDRHEIEGMTDNKSPPREWVEARLGMTVGAAFVLAAEWEDRA